MSTIQPTIHKPIYLDGHATTPLAPEAERAMAPWWRAAVGNPHSPHGAGQRAAQAVDVAREQVARLIGAAASEVVFTSGATEANALAIIGTARAAVARGDRRRRILVSAVEHKSVLACAASLLGEGFDVVAVPVTAAGVVTPEAVATRLSGDVLLVSVMAANNEVGVLQPIEQIAYEARRAGALVHVDASQQVGKVAIDLSVADLASVSSHKMYGPGGVGALFISASAPLRPVPLFGGGGQEQGLRPGTLPTPLIVGFGAAAELAAQHLLLLDNRERGLVDRLVRRLLDAPLNFIINGLEADRLPGSLSLRFADCDAASLIARLSREVSLAEGSACTSGQITPSHVLTAMGLSAAEASSTVRIFCGRYNTEAEIDAAAEAIAAALHNETVASWTDRPVGSRHERRATRF